MSANYEQTCERVWEGERVFACDFPVRDDYGVSEAKWEVYRLGDEWWLQGSYNETNSFARFAGTPDLEQAEAKAPARNYVLGECSALVPNPSGDREDSESAETLFGCGLDLETYEHNAF